VNWPQVIVIIFWLLGLVFKASEHGKPIEGEHNFMLSFMKVLISAIVLYCGGFFQL